MCTMVDRNHTFTTGLYMGSLSRTSLFEDFPRSELGLYGNPIVDLIARIKRNYRLLYHYGTKPCMIFDLSGFMIPDSHCSELRGPSYGSCLQSRMIDFMVYSHRIILSRGRIVRSDDDFLICFHEHDVFLPISWSSWPELVQITRRLQWAQSFNMVAIDLP